MQTKHLCVLIHIWTKGKVGAPWNPFCGSFVLFMFCVCVLIHICSKSEVGALWNWLKPSSKIIYWLFQGGASLVDHLCYYCLVLVCIRARLFIGCIAVTCWERADLLALVYDVLLWSCHFSIGILEQVWCLIVSIPDLCHFSYLGQNDWVILTWG